MMDFTDKHESVNDGIYFMVTKTMQDGTMLFLQDNDGFINNRKKATLYTGEDLDELFDENDLDPKGTEPVVIYPVTRPGYLTKQGIKNDAAYRG